MRGGGGGGGGGGEGPAEGCQTRGFQNSFTTSFRLNVRCRQAQSSFASVGLTASMA